jgi:protein TonB
MGIVAALHVGVLFIIARSMGIGGKPMEVPPLVGTVIDEPLPPDDPVPVTQPNLTPRDSVVIPEPDLPPVAIEPDVITGPPPDVINPPPMDPPFMGPVMVGVRPDARYPLTKPPYPPELIREGKTGSADVEVYVLPTGRVGDARIVRSSGIESLDRSTLAEAKRKWRLLPATRDGVPIAQWHRLRVTFKLNEQ